MMVDVLVSESFASKLKEYSFMKMPSLKMEGFNNNYNLYWLTPQNK